MIWTCYEVSGNKCSKNCYENERWREKRKKMTKNEMVGYDWEWYEGRWCVHKGCRKSRWIDI
jgi:hypothetical protein